MKTGIYEIRNTSNGKKYVGSAVDFGARWSKHRSELRRGVHHSRHLQQSWDKHGPDAFSFRKLLLCEKHELMECEQMAFIAFKPEFNILPNAASPLGVKRTKEFCDAIGKRKKGQTHTQETKDLISLRCRAAKANRPSHNSGVAVPQHVKEKIGQSLAKLTDGQVREIRAKYASGVQQKHLAPLYGLSKPSVSDIIRGATYNWVK